MKRLLAVVAVALTCACSAKSTSGGPVTGDDDTVIDLDPNLTPDDDLPSDDDGPGDGMATDDGAPTDDDAPPPLVPVTPTVCDPPIAAVDVSTPDHVVGTGTAASCTQQALQDAVTAGGIVTFDCGGRATIHLTSHIVLPPKTVTIDGGGAITIDGGDSTRLFHSTYTTDVAAYVITFQHLMLQHGHVTPTHPVSVTYCSDGYAAADGGGAIYVQDLSNEVALHVVDVAFAYNTAAARGQDVGGGAIAAFGPDVVIVGSTFTSNSAANGGALWSTGGNVSIVNSVLTAGAATGTGSNPGCGGIGGAAFIDGADALELTICGSRFTSNTANDLGGAFLRVAYSSVDARTTIDRSTIADNSAKGAGGFYLQDHVYDVSATTISGNHATGGAGGGARITGGQLTMLNTTIAGNTATSLGGGLQLNTSYPPLSGAVVNTTIVGNSANFAAAISSGSDTTLELYNSIIADNVAENIYNQLSCLNALAGSNVLQWPATRGSGTADSGCIASPTYVDPLVGALGSNGGSTQTALPGAPAAAAGLPARCPDVDQRGTARAETCTVGAVELP